MVGTGLFDIGIRDGPAREALLQHPLGVTVLPDGSVAVSDTYNGAVRRFDPASGALTALAGDLAERAHGRFAQTTQRPVTEVAADLGLTITFEPPPGQKVDDRFGPRASSWSPRPHPP